MTIETMKSKLANLKSTIPTLISRLPLLAFGALVIVLGSWWLEHNASLRREGALKEIQRQSAAEVAALRAHAEAAARDAQQTNARATAQLEISRRAFEKQSQDLRQRLAALQASERARVNEVASLPAEEALKRLEAHLGPGGVLEMEPGKSGVRNQEAEENHPERVVRGQLPMPSTTDIRFQSTDGSSKSQTPKGSEALIATPGSLTLTEAGARKVETAFVELASCLEQESVRERQLSACEQERMAEQQMVAQQKSAMDKLNQALSDNDQVLARRESAFKAELKAARGSWLQRASRTALHIAIGVGIGLVVR